MLSSKPLLYSYLTLIVCIVFCLGCGNVVPPDGGEKDLTPPVLLSILPADSQLNVKPRKIVLKFNKYMEIKDLESQMKITPLMRYAPTVTVFGKRIEIALSDTLMRPNTTYKLMLGNALTDNREATPYPNFEYLFATGSYFDSLTLEGYVVNAHLGLPDSGATAMLFEASATDSIVKFGKPIYVAPTDRTGYFSFNILPATPFRLVVVGDDDNSFNYASYAERIAFYDKEIRPDIDSSLPTLLYTFFEAPPNDSLKDTKKASEKPATEGGGLRGRGAAAQSRKKDAAMYSVLVDTSSVEKRTFDVTSPLKIILSDTNITIDPQRIYLSYDADGISAEAISDVVTSGDTVLVKTNWMEDKVYTLRLVKGWARDSANNEIPPGKYIFRTKSKDDFGELKINFNDTLLQSNYFTIITSDGGDTVYYGKVIPLIHLKYLKPTMHEVFIFEDKNEDGVWTTGNFEQRILPEIMIPHEGKLSLRAGWENQIDFKPFIFDPQKIKTGSMRDKKDNDVATPESLDKE